ncbi:MAG TPA: formate dehydrogenase accessory protein FdhE [Steroidobacteraceae bacterium]|nr:formate dehydrogenase accessory protein FdhE [Steroidobacteraceae bacterium]
MPRILEPGQIEAHGQRAVPRIRLPGADGPFAARARRLRQLAAPGAVGSAIAQYLELTAALADAQAHALTDFPAAPPTATEIARAHTHRMPVIHAGGRPRAPQWRALALRLSGAVCAGGAPPGLRRLDERLRGLAVAELDAQADALLAGRTSGIDVAAAPFLMAALQVHWVALASRLKESDVAPLEVPGVCPACGTPPVASVVRADQDSQGHRYLHCALCATEWHLVRVTCSQCQNTENIGYHSIEGGSAAIRAESCDRCHTYRKILYQEKDADVEPVADDLASLALDLLMAEAGYHRGSGNPLLWHEPVS